MPSSTHEDTTSILKASGQYTVTFGGWYQRTTLHLSEIYGFLSAGFSKLNLSKVKLERLQQSLDLTHVSREVGYFEYVYATTRQGIEIRYYEDGLYIFQLKTDDIDAASQQLRDYYENLFEPAMAYLFSLGAPTPKLLANLKTEHQIVVHGSIAKLSEFRVDEKYGDVYSHLSHDDIAVAKTTSHIFIMSRAGNSSLVQELVEMQIFFREFKDQLEKYLNIHRDIWEAIDQIATRKHIRGKEVEKVRALLDSYKKTIGLITNRINQMGNYANTRASITDNLKLEDELLSLFQYKFEVLTDTLEYIKEIWVMTSDYLDQAIDIVSDIQSRAANSSIESLRAITTIGVITGVLAYLQTTELPQAWVTQTGIIYFAIIFTATWLVNWAVGAAYRMIRYKVEFVDRVSKI